MISSTELLRSRKICDSHVYSLILPGTRTLQLFTNTICGEKPSSWLDRRASDLSLEPVVGASSTVPNWVLFRGPGSPREPFWGFGSPLGPLLMFWVPFFSILD